MHLVTSDKLYRYHDGDADRLVIYFKRPDQKYDIYAPLITKDEELYVDDSKKMLYVKHVFILLYRPIHGAIKWVTIPIDLYLDWRDAKGDFSEKLVERIKDIFLIPSFTLAMALVHLTGVILGVVYPGILYWTREKAGKLELKMYRVTCWEDTFKSNSALPLVAPCFTSVAGSSYLEFMWDKEDNIMSECDDIINYMRTYRDFFNCYRTIGEEPYISPALKGMNLSHETINAEEHPRIERWQSMCRYKEKDQRMGCLDVKLLNSVKERPWSRRTKAKKCGVSVPTLKNIERIKKNIIKWRSQQDKITLKEWCQENKKEFDVYDRWNKDPDLFR